MQFTRARYVTVCQQFLVTAVVLAVALSAAGVATLQIVAPESGAPEARTMAPAITVSPGYADTAPVAPKVKEVPVAGVDAKALAALPAGERAAAARELARPAAPAAGGQKTARTGQPRRLVALSEPTPVTGYATVGVTWKHGTELDEREIKVQVRTQKDGVWSGWSDAAYHDDHAPDAGTAEAARVRPGTDAIVVGDVDAVQMKAETTTGRTPPGMELAVVDPGTGKETRQKPAIDTGKITPSTDTAALSSMTMPAVDDTTSDDVSGDDVSGDDVSLAAMRVAPKPYIYSRAQWGANEALREQTPPSYGTIKTSFIHHTVNANNYTAAQVPALIRGIYAYHTQSRGWRDIGYNFLVDRFGRIWEGRWGGVDRAVVGAHTQGYNEVSFAMSSIGNFDVAQPPQALLNAYAALFAWKLSLYNIQASATHLWVKNRYLNAINGHRDAGSTACPGRYLYAKIPSVRVAAQAIQNKAQIPPDPVNQAMLPAPTGLPKPTQAPTAAVAQPKIAFPARTSLAGTSWPDLLTQGSDGYVRVHMTQGQLDFDKPLTSGGAWSFADVITTVGDVTGDKHPDVLARSRATGLTRLYPGDASGRIVPTPRITTRVFTRVTTLFPVGDLNRDGKVDVAGRNRRTGRLQLFRGLGGGWFGAPTRLTAGTWPFAFATAAGDLNRDGRPDVVAASGTGIYLVRGTSTGGLAAPVRVGTAPGTIYGLAAGGDMTRDSRPDVVVRTSAGTFLYAGAGNGGFGQRFGALSRAATVSSIFAAPMAGSADLDLVGRDSAGHLVTLVNNRLYNMSAPLSPNLRPAGATQVLNAGDWDRNGKGDVLVRTAAGDQLVFYPGLGNGRFGRPTSFGTGWKPFTMLAAVGDVTGDGLPDLLGRTATGPMTLFPGAGMKGYTAPRLAPGSMKTFHQIGSAAWSPRGAVLTAPGGTFVPLTGVGPATALRMANGTTTTTYDAFVGVGDANGDGVADVLAREKGTGVLWLLPGKTSGGFAPRMWVANGFAGYRLIG